MRRRRFFNNKCSYLNNLFKKLLKYFLVGCLTVPLNLGTVLFSVEFLHFHYRLAVVLGFIFSVSLGFLFNRTWTFASESKERLRQYFKYFSIALSGMSLNVILITVLVEVFGLWYLLAQFILNPIIGFRCFLTNRRWTF